MKSVSPFARFNLFRNPFGELTVSERAELAVVDLEEYLAWLERSSRAAIQVTGPCGHGKSTHLRALQYAWAERHAPADLPAFVYFPEEGDQPALPRSRPLFVDEAQRMRWWRRRQLLAGPGPLVIGTHRDMSRELTSAGFQLLTVDLDCSMPPARLQELLNRRIDASRSASPRLTSRSASAAIGEDSSNEVQRGMDTSPDMLLEAGLPMETGSLRRVCLGETDLRETDLRETDLRETDLRETDVRETDLLLTIAQVVALQERFGSNVRQIEDYLYERFQSFALKGEPWLPVD